MLVAAAGTRFAVDDAGNGPALVLVHAGVADRRMWDAVLPGLGGRRTVRYDLRGFGDTEPGRGAFAHHRDLLALLDALGIERASVAGSSFGGLVALEAAAVAPARVARLVLLAPPLPDHRWSAAMEAFGAAEEAALAAGDLDAAVRCNVETWAAQLDARGRALVAAMQRRAFDFQLTAETDEEELNPPVTERLGDLRLPVELLVGDADLPDFPAIARRLARALPDARLTVLPGAGHLLPMERPGDVAAVLRRA